MSCKKSFYKFFLLVIGKAKEMRGFSKDLNMLMEGADRIAIGKEFQNLGPIIEKALSPKQTLCARGSIALYPSHERRLLEGCSRLILLVRYAGAREFRDL